MVATVVSLSPCSLVSCHAVMAVVCAWSLIFVLARTSGASLVTSFCDDVTSRAAASNTSKSTTVVFSVTSLLVCANELESGVGCTVELFTFVAAFSSVALPLSVMSTDVGDSVMVTVVSVSGTVSL